MPSRRAYLVSLAAASFAGCTGTAPRSTSDPSSEPKTSGTPARPALTIEASAVQYSYRHIHNVDWNAIRPADGQFVFVTVDASQMDPLPGPDAFTMVADDAVYDPLELDHRAPYNPDISGQPYAPDPADPGPRGWLVFDVPAQLVADPALRFERDNESWTWDLDTEKATAPPPAWEWTASAPETVRPDESFDITVTATNVGDGPGTFRGAVNFSYPLYRPKGFDISLEPGASDETTVSATSRDAEPGTRLEYGVRTPAGQSTVAVTVESESSRTETSN